MNRINRIGRRTWICMALIALLVIAAAALGLLGGETNKNAAGVATGGADAR